MSFDDMLVHLCDVVSYNGTQSVSGAYVKVASGTVTDQVCRFMSPTRQRAQFEPVPEIGGLIQTDKILIFRSTTGLNTENTITNVRMRYDASVIDSDSYEVMEVSPRYGRSLHHKSARLQKVK